MSRLKFQSSEQTTLGVEVELALVDAQSMALRSANPDVLAQVPPELQSAIKPELLECYVEVNSAVCKTVSEAEADLRYKLETLESIMDTLSLRAYWSGTHPFSTWRDQNVTQNDRYQGLVKSLQDTARQLVTFGLHVHVGVDSGDKAVMICDRILRHLPTLLAASCNSPFWEGRATGLGSWRSKIMDGLPTAGLPPLMRNWSEYVWLVHHLVETGYIETIREIWWDVRPHHNFGTVELRICDIPGNLDDTLALSALIQCLVKALSDQIDQGTYQHDCHPMIIRQNKWRAARYGLDAQIVDSDTYEMKSAREVLCDLVRRLQPTAKQLNCQAYLKRVSEMAKRPTWAQQQLSLLSHTDDLARIVRQLTEQSRLSRSIER